MPHHVASWRYIDQSVGSRLFNQLRPAVLQCHLWDSRAVTPSCCFMNLRDFQVPLCFRQGRAQKLRLRRLRGLPFHSFIVGQSCTTDCQGKNMGFGIKEPRGSQNALVPGTSLLFDHSKHNTATTKHASGHNAELLLVPQPSDSPNDPLVRTVDPRLSCNAHLARRTGHYGRKTWLILPFASTSFLEPYWAQSWPPAAHKLWKNSRSPSTNSLYFQDGHFSHQAVLHG